LTRQQGTVQVASRELRLRHGSTLPELDSALVRFRLFLAVAALAASVAGGSAMGAKDVFVTFRTPSHNIGCGYSKFAGEQANVRCDIRSGLKPRPPKPKNCDLDWAYGYAMGRRGRASTLCAGDTVLDPKAPVLAYGHTWRRNGFTCTSRATGLTCRNLSGHGFFLSREHSRVF
jgi:hypothetical protein